MRLATPAFALLLIGSYATSAQAAWLVYAGASARATANTQVIDSTLACSGPLGTPGACGQTALIFPNATSLTSSATATVVPTGVYAFYGAQHADAMASADLVTGKLRVTTHASSEGVGSEQTSAGANAQFQDTLNFSSLTNDPFSVRVRLHVDGIYDGNQAPQFSFQMGALNAGSVAWLYGGNGGPSCVGNPGPGCSQQAGFQSFNVSPGWTQFGPSEFVGTVNFLPGQSTVNMRMVLSASGNTSRFKTGFADFGNTASVQFDLPEGVSFTSDSGVFLTARDGAVPEPATWALMIGGFGLAGVMLRRRRAVAA